MQASSTKTNSIKTNRRSQDRFQAVLPVRVRGTDADGMEFEALAHTLDLTPTGIRLGSIRCELKKQAKLTVIYHQRRREFSVMWTKRLESTSEYQVVLQAFAQEQEPWGVNLFGSKAAAASEAA